MTAATRKRLQPRKAPRQERAQATVAAILEAAAYILARDGWSGLTTNKIADRAGVNIASLYQYFPSKEAIAAELQRQHGDQVRSRVHTELPSARPEDLRSLLRERIEAAVQEHQAAPGLHKALAEELPRSARRDPGDAEAIVEQWRVSAAPLFRNVPDAGLAEFVARTAVHAVVHEAAIQRPDLLAHPLLVDELVTLLDGYLRRPASRS